MDMVMANSTSDIPSTSISSTSSISSSIISKNISITSSIDEYDEEPQQTSTFCCGLCCMKGCVWGVVAALYFFLFMPGGIMLVMYGYYHSLTLTLLLGILVLCVTTCGLPALFFLLRFLRHRQRKRGLAEKKRRDEQKARVTYDNPAALDIQT